MGNYDDHLEYGYGAYALVFTAIAGAALSGGVTVLVAAGLAVLAAPLTMLGAVFPDIDHHASHPHRAFKRLVFAATTITAFCLLAIAAFEPLAVALSGMLAGFADVGAMVALHCLSLAVGVGAVHLVVRYRPTHRGITHRVPTGATLATTIGGGFWYIAGLIPAVDALLAGLFLGGAFFIGFLSHLQCDRMLGAAVADTGSSLRQKLQS